jgi:hypothetical protein
MTEKKVFPLKNVRTFFCLSSVRSAIFHNFFIILQQCLDTAGTIPNPNPNFFSDSDLAKILGLFWIRIHNTALKET